MLKKLSKKAGARLVIHDTRSPPLPDEYGIDLQPNTASSIAIQKNDVERKAAPYDSNCSDSWTSTGYNIDTNMTYTLAACQRYCLQKDLIDSCECFHPDLYQAAIPLHENVRTCNVLPVSNNTDYTCFERVFEEYNKLKRNCSCTVACQETEFASTVSVSKWPSNQYFVEFGLNLKGVEYSQDDLKGKGDNSGEVQSELQQNYVQADIYYQTLNVRSIVQEAKYSEDGYVAALGGALSVYMGIAVIMIFELLELVIDLVLNVWKFYNGANEEKH
ncbi:degenerin deg-1-like [Tigriopus californicus]|uniref:degenerin deg-1-like n=1 Tax=Tigriopus californicus TaxID=6832 RepID=UPI0027DA9D6C|nr:degenerin deg-1-like [Tigriopus californicus]